GMPIPAVPEALSKGVIEATTMPWEVTEALKVPELVTFHTEFEGPMLYTVTFVLAMNKAKYDSLPDDLKQVIDDNSGLEFSIFAGSEMAASDGPSRQLAVDAGNSILTVSEADAAVWRETAEPIYAAWIAEMEARGIDGQALIDDARRLMAEQGS
ncbi:MAG: C4-dicarboxylate ABC transporter, partial [Pseudomonadota bacterium]